MIKVVCKEKESRPEDSNGLKSETEPTFVANRSWHTFIKPAERKSRALNQIRARRLGGWLGVIWVRVWRGRFSKI